MYRRCNAFGHRVPNTGHQQFSISTILNPHKQSPILSMPLSRALCSPTDIFERSQMRTYTGSILCVQLLCAQYSAYSCTLKAPDPACADLMGMMLGGSPPWLDTGDPGSPSTHESADRLLRFAVYATTSKVHPAGTGSMHGHREKTCPH